jgi:hypothetical protein
MSRIRLGSLLLVEERLLEAEYFARRLRRLSGNAFGYELNAFLSAARSITFLLHKEMAHVQGFSDWWETGPRRKLDTDPAARFFLNLRNFSQKEGRVSLVGTASDSNRRRWSYRFAGNKDRVPPQLLNRDVVDCCLEHIAKLARVILACTDALRWTPNMRQPEPRLKV